MVHSMILNNRIFCAVGIFIFRFKKYRKTVFNLMELNMRPIFKQILQARTVNAKKRKSYYQWYYVKKWEPSTKRKLQNSKYTRTYLHGEVIWITDQECALKQVLSPWKNQKHPPQEVNQKNRIRNNKIGTNMDPSSTYELTQRITM